MCFMESWFLVAKTRPMQVKLRSHQFHANQEDTRQLFKTLFDWLEINCERAVVNLGRVCATGIIPLGTQTQNFQTNQSFNEVLQVFQLEKEGKLYHGLV